MTVAVRTAVASDTPVPPDVPNTQYCDVVKDMRTTENAAWYLHVKYASYIKPVHNSIGIEGKRNGTYSTADATVTPLRRMGSLTIASRLGMV